MTMCKLFNHHASSQASGLTPQTPCQISSNTKLYVYSTQAEIFFRNVRGEKLHSLISVQLSLPCHCRTVMYSHLVCHHIARGGRTTGLGARVTAFLLPSGRSIKTWS